MWPFRSKEEHDLPPWRCESINQESSKIMLSGDNWFITDGCRIDKSSIKIGYLRPQEIEIVQLRNADELSTCEIKFSAGQGTLANAEVVVDSGFIVLRSLDTLSKKGNSEHTSRLLLKLISKHCVPGEMVAVLASGGVCIAIAISPALGDGAYRLNYIRNVMTLDIGNSV